MKKHLEISAWQFNPKWTTSYGLDMKDRVRELDDLLSNGYLNSVILEVEHFATEELWQVLEKHKVKVWFCVWKVFDSTKETLEQFVEPFDRQVDFIRDNPNRWEMFNGFCYDETFIRGETEEDFISLTKHFYEKYNKRNFPVMAVLEFCELWRAPHTPPQVTSKAFEYVTDVAFDVYAIDVRDGATNTNERGGGLPEAQYYFPQITDGKSFFKILTEAMLERANRPMNVWFYPSAHAYNAFCSLEGTTRENEDYCLGHLNFFNEYLKEFEHAGGLVLYTYFHVDSYPDDLYCMHSFLEVKDENGNQKIRPKDNVCWKKYSDRLRELTAEYRETEANLILEPQKENK